MTTHRRTPGLDRNGNVDRVGAITRRHLPKIAGGVALGLAAAAAGLAQPAVIGSLIGALGTDADLALPVAIIVGLFVAEAALTATQAYAMGRTGERIVHDTRTTLVDRVLAADVGAFAALRQGDVFARVVTDTALLKVALSQSLAGIMVDGAMVLGGIVLMLLIDPMLLGVTAACLTVASLVALLLARRLRRAAQHSRTLVGDFGADLQRALAASTTVKACRAEGVESARLGGLAL
ncbi:ABC transporter transmembrane domain-containing protein, partial [Saccharomonospora halophila]|uniref:ABC transporter transmembrane domain-containing protein n=1 Tax=Saccharomonospora halophila TaxID=129922 RepID=UPI0003810A18